MPSDTQLKNANPKGTPKGGKKPPMGIPIWGWMIAAVLGIIIGYTILKKSGGGSATSQDAQSPDQSTGASGDPGASGSVALPPDSVLSALGLTPTGGGASQTSATSTTTDSSATQEANQMAVAPSISAPVMNGAQTEGSTMGSASAIMPGSSPIWQSIAELPSGIPLASQFRSPPAPALTVQQKESKAQAVNQAFSGGVHTAGL